MSTETQSIPDPPDANLAAALAAFQRELPRVGKDNIATVKSAKANYRYQYADLADVSAAVLPALGRQGLSWITVPTVQDGRFELHYELLHTSGESRVGVWPLPAISSSPQELGSAITYARRYTLCAVTGVSPDNDDDGAAAQAQARRRDQGNPEPDFDDSRDRYAPEEPGNEARESPDWTKQIAAADTAGDLTALHELWGKVTGQPEHLEHIKAAAARVRERHMKRLFVLLAEGGISGGDEHKPQRYRIATRILGKPVTSYTALKATDVAKLTAALVEHQKAGDLTTWLASQAAEDQPDVTVMVDRILSAPDAEAAAVLLQEVAAGSEGDIDVAYLLTADDRDTLGYLEGQPLLFLDLAAKGVEYATKHKTGPRVPPIGEAA
jgi:hypothetical protein